MRALASAIVTASLFLLVAGTVSPGFHDDENGFQARLTRLEAQMETLLGAVNALTERVGKTQPEGTSRAQYSHHAPPAAAPSVKVGVDAQEHGGGGGGTGWWLTILAVHEAWLLMQHANVLCNPFLQRMDRKYGISLLKKRMYWVIASVLGLYWARETISMALSHSHVSLTTGRMIVISVVYHWVKIGLVSLDAHRRFSPRLGIMMLLIDQWHADTLFDVLITIKRVVLQGFDTTTHLLIVRDMCARNPSLYPFVGATAFIWMLHSVACQVTGKSTATLFVEFFKHRHLVKKGASAEFLSGNSGIGMMPLMDDDVAFGGGGDGGGSDGLRLAVDAVGVLFTLASVMLCRSQAISPLAAVGGCALGMAAWVSSYESNRVSGKKEKYTVRYLLTRDKDSISGDSQPQSSAAFESASASGGGGIFQQLSHLAGWGSSGKWSGACEVAFIAHPTTLSSAFAHWGGGGCVKFQETALMRIVSPFVWLYSWLWMLVSPGVCGPYLEMDRFEYSGMKTGVWLSRVFGWQIISMPRTAEKRIEEALKVADRAGVKVLGLGALNKAEFVNEGGDRLVSRVRPSNTRVVHGNTLTAAAVIENVLSVVPAGGRVFLTGPTSKVGRAVAIGLLRAGVNVVCHTSSAERFDKLQRECMSLGITSNEIDGRGASTATVGDSPCGDGEHGAGDEKRCARSARISMSRDLSEGTTCDTWVVGKFDPKVRTHVPFGGCAVVFAVPCPFSDAGGSKNVRTDLTVIDGGLLRLDTSRCSRRCFSILLDSDMVYACHAAALVHLKMGWQHHEVGEVDVFALDQVMRAAKSLGFSLPSHGAVSPSKQPGSYDADGVREITALVVGGGASGLAAGASLRMAGVQDVVIVEGRPSIEGHWGSQYDSLSITSRREHCSLPYYPVPEGGRFPVELSARDFIEYLRTYAARFSLDVQLSTIVKSARRQGVGWIVETSAGTYRCQHLVVASGLHNRPKFPPREAQMLSEGGGFAGQVMHSSQVRGLESIAMRDVAIVGFGNSASDITMSLLKRGARSVTVSVRTFPPIVRRQWGPLSVEWVSRLALQHLPTSVADACAATFSYINFGHNWWVPYVPKGTRSWGPYSSGRTPVIDKWAGEAEGGLVDRIKRGDVQFVGAIEGLCEGGVVFGGGGGARRVDVVVFATGFETSYGDWLEGGTSHKSETGLHFVGFTSGQALLPLKGIGVDAQKVAKTVAFSRGGRR